MLPNSVIRLILLVAAFGAAVWGWGQLSQTMQSRVDWTDRPGASGSTPTAKLLFRELADRGLIHLSAQKPVIELAPEDLHLQLHLARTGGLTPDPGLAGKWPIARNTRDLRAIERLIRVLYSSGEGQPGALVRAAVDQWNRAHGLVAIRDELSIEGDDVQAGAATRTWRASTVIAGASAGVRRGVTTAPGLSQDIYGFFGWGNPSLRAPVGPWVSAAPNIASGSAQVEFRRRLPANVAVTLDMLGAEADISVTDPASGTSTSPAVEVWDFCPDSRTESGGIVRASSVPTDCDLSTQKIARRAILAAAPVERTLVVRVEPVRIVPDLFAKILEDGPPPVIIAPDCDPIAAGIAPHEEAPAARQERCWPGWRPYAAGGPIVVYCRDGASAAECSFEWRSSVIRPETPPNAVEIVTADGMPLVLAPVFDTTRGPEDVRMHLAPAPAVEELGLVELIGYAEVDRLGLLYHLHRRAAQHESETEVREDANASEDDSAEGGDTRPIQLDLTVRAGMQRIARRALIETVGPDRSQDLQNRLPTDFDGVRRAAVVLIDASGRCNEDDRGCPDGQTRGHILAAANWPEAGYQRAIWNAIGYDYWRPRFSPLAPSAWARTDAQFAPGSTFKVVTALAAIREAVASSDRRIEEILRGRGRIREINPSLPQGMVLKPHAFEMPSKIRYTGAPKSCGGEPRIAGAPKEEQTIHRLCNFGRGGVEAAQLPPAQTGCVRYEAAGDTQLGLCEAVLTSQNAWFSALAMVLEKAQPSWVSAATVGIDPRADDEPDVLPAIVRMAHRLAPPDRFSLLSELDPADPNAGPFAARWKSYGFIIDTARAVEPGNGRFPNRELGLTAIGQNMQAAPTTMAGVMASVATGCVVRPTLMDIGVTPCTPLFFDPEEERGLVNEATAFALMRDTLWKGMNGAINRPAGTADSYFKDADWAKYVYGKTGTAEFVRRGNADNTGWLAGWIEPEAIPGIDRRIAFACMVTHVKGGSFGADACGPAIRNIIEGLRAAQPVQP